MNTDKGKTKIKGCLKTGGVLKTISAPTCYVNRSSTVSAYLKGCHQQNALERLPDWQLDVDWELYRLKGQVRLLMVMMVLLLAVVLLLCLLVGVGVCYV